MPLSMIEVRKIWSPEQAQAIIGAICLAQREALKVPENDRQIRLIEHAPELFHVPPGKSEYSGPQSQDSFLFNLSVNFG